MRKIVDGPDLKFTNSRWPPLLLYVCLMPIKFHPISPVLTETNIEYLHIIMIFYQHLQHYLHHCSLNCNAELLLVGISLASSHIFVNK